VGIASSPRPAVGTGDRVPAVNGTPISGTVRLNDGDLIEDDNQGGTGMTTTTPRRKRFACCAPLPTVRTKLAKPKPNCPPAKCLLPCYPTCSDRKKR